MPLGRFVFLLILLAASVRVACADSAPQERLYFLRADRSVFAITFQDNHPRAIRRLYSGWEGQKFSSEMLEWGRQAGVAGRTSDERPLATYLGDQVHALGDSMVIETDYRMQLWSTFVPYPIGESRRVTEPDHPDGARLRRLLYFRPGTAGAWDCFAREDFEPDVKDQEGEAARQVALWRTTPPGRTTVSTDELLPIPSEDLIPLLKTAETDTAAVLAPLDQLRARFPQDPFLATLALDLALIRKDEARLTAQLNDIRPILTAAGGTFYAPSIPYYQLWLDRARGTREGRNIDATLRAALQSQDIGGQTMSRGDFERIVRDIKPGDTYFSLLRPLLLQGDLSIPNTLYLQTQYQLTRVEADFDLLSGDPSAALNRLVPSLRLGAIMTGESTDTISSLIGIACSHLTTRAMENVYLCGFDSAETIKANWPVLDELYRLHHRESESPLALRIATGDGFPAPSSAFPDTFVEAGVRNKTALSRLALLHTVTALRYQVLKDGYLPPGWGNLELLPDGPDPDPFGKRRERLHILPWRKDVDLVVYSVGPDGDDDRSAIDYDPTNGTISSGDVILKSSDPPRYPFPRRGELGRTRDEILAQFPNGLPPDPFADTKGSGYTVTDQVPAAILSWGRDIDQGRIPGQAIPADATAPAGMAISTQPDGSRIGYPALMPELPYDPTNGTYSEGDLVYRRK